MEDTLQNQMIMNLERFYAVCRDIKDTSLNREFIAFVAVIEKFVFAHKTHSPSLTNILNCLRGLKYQIIASDIAGFIKKEQEEIISENEQKKKLFEKEGSTNSSKKSGTKQLLSQSQDFQKGSTDLSQHWKNMKDFNPFSSLLKAADDQVEIIKQQGKLAPLTSLEYVLIDALLLPLNDLNNLIKIREKLTHSIE